MSRLKVTIDRTGDLAKALKALGSLQVLVGIPSSTAERKPDPADPHPLNNAEIGYLMENGSPAANIPARPFLRPGIRGEKAAIVARLKSAGNAALTGDLGAVEKGLTAAGLIAEAAVKAKITDGPFAALAPSTIAKRKARGRSSDKPLIDTGQLRNAVTSVVRPR